MATVTFEGTTRIYPKSKRRAVDRLNLNISDGEFLVLVGPSGCGKTTSLRMLAGLEDVDEGTIRIDGKDVVNLPPRSRDIAMVFQNYALYPHMSVAENMGFALKIARVGRAEIRERVQEAAKILDLEDFLDRRPGQLSGGQRQRVAMGRAIVRQPQVFLMDEPLSNLDAKLRVATRSQIAALQRRLGVTTVYVTHDQVEAMTMGDRVAVMCGGVLQQCDTPRTLFDSPVNAFVAGFIGSPAMNLIEGRIAEAGVAIGETVFALPRDLAIRAGRPGTVVTVGLRPESVSLATPSETAPTLRAVVNVVEELGAEAYLYTQLAEHADRSLTAGSDVIARIEPGIGPPIGHEVRLRIKDGAMLLFDAEERAADQLMRIALMIEGQEGVTWEQWVALGRAAEDAQLDGLFRSDHYRSVNRGDPAGALDAWVTLGALAVCTRRIRLGTLVSPVTFRHPAVLAKAVVSVDHISGGRAELGIGTGWFEPEHAAYGFPFPGAVERFEELERQLAELDRQWGSSEIWPKPVQRPHPPIIVGGRAKPRSVAAAVRYADEYNTVAPTLEQARERSRILRDAARDAGREPLAFSMFIAAVLGRDEAEAAERCRAWLASTSAPVTPQLVGTVEQVAQAMREYKSAGVERAMVAAPGARGTSKWSRCWASWRARSRTTRDRPAAYRKHVELGLRFFEQMHRTGALEDEVQRMCAEGLVRGTTHLCQGEEAAAVGACGALAPGDRMTRTYRGHGGATLIAALVAEHLERLDAPPRLVGGDETPISYVGELEREWLRSAQRIAAEAARCVAY